MDLSWERPMVSTGWACSPVWSTTFQNNLDVAVLGIVIMVLHNNLGQTVFFSTATLNLTRGLSGTAYNVEFGLPPGIYNATILRHLDHRGRHLELHDGALQLA